MGLLLLDRPPSPTLPSLIVPGVGVSVAEGQEKVGLGQEEQKVATTSG